MTPRVFLLLLALAASAFAQTTEVVDTLFLNDAAGTRRVGRVVGIDATTFKLEVPLSVGPAGATAKVSVPRAQVSRIEFAPNAARERLLANPTAASTIALNVEWLRWQAYLSVPKSPAAALANAYATALLAANDRGKATEALALFTRVEREGWSDADRQKARQGRLRAMIATGHAADAVSEAKAIAKEADDPTMLIEAKFILAEAAFSNLKKLVEENPRWTEDVLVRPEHERLYNEALDLYLHPYLFLGSETDAAARGLWGAVQVYRFGGDDADAIESARDLTQLYSGTKYAKLAADYLAKLPDDLKKMDAEKDAQEDQE
jgi:hypothetical protein